MTKAISVKWLSATESKGTRIKAYDSDGNTHIIPRDYALDSLPQEAIAACLFVEKMKWRGVYVAGHAGNNETVFVCIARDSADVPGLFDHLSAMTPGSWFEVTELNARGAQS